jgi:hypothetical protein
LRDEASRSTNRPSIPAVRINRSDPFETPLK